tara:strand:- start:746 stop:1240 length:495 start_codon:yes stop_codon:yes gene_type:complete
MHIDDNCKKFSNISLPVIYIGFFFLIGGACTLLNALITKPFVGESIIDVILILILACLSYTVVVKIYFGRQVVYQIDMIDKKIRMYTMLEQTKFIKFSDIMTVLDFKPDWFMTRFHLNKDDHYGLSIALKDGRSFRVSPHMERIDELKEALKSIIQANQGKAAS